MKKKSNIKGIASTPGITLIALVVTIVVLIILATISINIIFSEGGILERARQGREDYAQGEAREILELALADLLIEKQINNQNYNENKYIDDELNKKGMLVNGDIVTVNGWQFKINRENLKIIQDLGKGKINEQIQIELVETPEESYTKATITIKVSSDEEIKSIKINGEERTDFTKENGVYTITIADVTENKTYIIIATNIKDEQNIKTVAGSVITDNVDIYTAEDLIKFRERVNSGATYEGNTVRLMADIDINKGKWSKATDGAIIFESDATEWIPIGDIFIKEGNCFKGTFEGNSHSIDGIYINSENSHRGFFSYINGANVRNLTVSGSVRTAGGISGGLTGRAVTSEIQNCTNNITIDSSGATVGGIVGNASDNSIIQNCINNGIINSTSHNMGGIVGTAFNAIIQNCGNLAKINNTTADMYNIGGIVGAYSKSTNNIIKQCYNIGDIATTSGTTTRNIGGIIGFLIDGTTATIEDCYNTGNISNSNTQVGGIVGLISATTANSKLTVKNTYNTGTLSGSSYVGGIVGRAYNKTTDGVSYSVDLSVTNSYYLNTCGGSNIDEDVSKTSDQMQSLANTLGGTLWQNDEKDATTNKWKYNGGYPILSWQIK